jgi:hypothetical protein
VMDCAVDSVHGSMVDQLHKNERVRDQGRPLQIERPRTRANEGRWRFTGVGDSAVALRRRELGRGFSATIPCTCGCYA